MPVPDFASYLNTALGLLAGIAAGVLVFRLLRPLGVDWTVRRLTADMMADLAQLAVGRRSAAFPLREPDVRPDQRPVHPARSLRAGQLATMRGSLAALRVGLNTLALHRRPPEPGAGAGARVAGVLATLARWFGARAAEETSPLPSSTPPWSGCWRRARAGRGRDAGGPGRHPHQPESASGLLRAVRRGSGLAETRLPRWRMIREIDLFGVYLSPMVG